MIWLGKSLLKLYQNLYSKTVSPHLCLNPDRIQLLLVSSALMLASSLSQFKILRTQSCLPLLLPPRKKLLV